MTSRFFGQARGKSRPFPATCVPICYPKWPQTISGPFQLRHCLGSTEVPPLVLFEEICAASSFPVVLSFPLARFTGYSFLSVVFG